MTKRYLANPATSVLALAIVGIDPATDGTALLKLENGSTFRASAAMLSRIDLKEGDYLVRQEADGYEYLNPKAVFERKYVPAPAHGQMDFGAAIHALKAGQRVTRTGWNGKGLYLYYVPANAYPAQTEIAKQEWGADAKVPYNAYIALKGADGTVSTWAPSINDTLAIDWQVV